MLTQDLVTDLFTDAHFSIFKNLLFLLQCNSKPDWDPQQVAQIGPSVPVPRTQEFSSCGSKHLCRRLQTVICSCLTGHILMSPPDKLSAPFISSNKSKKAFPFCWHWTELVRMLQKLVVRNSLYWPYWHSCVNRDQAAKPLCRKFSPPALLSLYSYIFFQEFVEYSLQTAVAPTEAVTDSTSLPDGRNLLCTLLVAAAESHHPASSLQGLINSLLWIRKEF